MVDLGCGDFNVGKNIRNITDKYIACDSVPNVDNYNLLIYANEKVDFRVLNMVTEEPPAGDIVFIREVLQHSSNDHISRLLPKLRNYKWAIITENIPLEDPFVPNFDIETGEFIRFEVESGVGLTEKPFNIVPYNSTVLCEVIGRYFVGDQRVRKRTTGSASAEMKVSDH